MEVHRTTVVRIWKAFQQNALLPSIKARRSGRPPVYTPEAIASTVRELTQSLRSTMSDMSEATGIPLGSLHRALTAGTLQRRSTRIKPLLSDTNKEQRVVFCRSHVRPSGLPETLVFDDMWDVVHLDESGSMRTSTKRFIPTVTFLAAVARPRHDPESDVNFDGKIEYGLWVEFLPAVRSSGNRPAGSLVPTLVNLDAAVYRKYVITRVIPAIKLKFPTANKRVVLQHDNATPHGSLIDADFASVSTDRWTFVVRCQPPNSPDLFVLDLGFFASIQTLQYKLVSRSLGEYSKQLATAVHVPPTRAPKYSAVAANPTLQHIDGLLDKQANPDQPDETCDLLGPPFAFTADEMLAYKQAEDIALTSDIPPSNFRHFIRHLIVNHGLPLDLGSATTNLANRTTNDVVYDAISAADDNGVCLLIT
ncbi:hypothetical protein H310_10260 [Aphanomyces invadans]|uniref:Transposase Tc1-like domain-containing protein n=1 Tax=Aphanomyces invadans TaxID=157072 RepID=A0A024TRC7_9STRA|nr:hypothetical protein H310_10260 [Aphanomyces invadans]ETV96549.1 hypothetical protein H310_10260 [Aphanomyces invadans]|eukprot:XP_008874812.1 hypothetical protein H310_10260 [Aphanomyces invadans]